MDSKNFLGGMFGGSGKKKAPEPARRNMPARETGGQLSEAPYKKGDFIGHKYQVYETLGAGGFGIVYLVYSHETKWVYALKTFKDEYLSDSSIRERFRKECLAWVNLEHHSHLVRARGVEEISGRLYIFMEFIMPDENGINTLEGYLRRRPPDLAQSLQWAIQFCHGMEYAYTKGIRCHRDIKPANIMIGKDKMVKITDFGLAGVLGSSEPGGIIKLNIKDKGIGLSCMTVGGASFGTPTHMPPEQFTAAAECDQRSDIYSFGIVLYQMATGGKVPFTADPAGADEREAAGRYWKVMEYLHAKSPVPRIDSPLYPLIERCLEKDPNKRYQTFRELREELEPLLRQQTAEVMHPPELKELEAQEWSNKGGSLFNLGKYDEAIRCLDKALELDPRIITAWNNKGASLSKLGKYEEAIRCCDKALEIDLRYVSAWCNKGVILNALGKCTEAIVCYEKALQIDPENADVWNNKGISFNYSGKYEEAIGCCDKALQIDPRNAAAWINKAVSLYALGKYTEAIVFCDKALQIDPGNAAAWINKATSLYALGKYTEAIVFCDKALQIDPGNTIVWNFKGSCLHALGRYEDAIVCSDKALQTDPGNTNAWNNKGSCLHNLGKYADAIVCCDKALQIDPRDALAWNNKGSCLDNLGRYEEAILCCDRALELDPRYAAAWDNKGLGLDRLGRYDEAMHCYDKALELDPRRINAWNNKGSCLNNLGRYEDAIVCYDKALQIDPVHSLARKNKEIAEKHIRK
ncbi:MAG: tetratricopeptide repeat protein [Dehalococcoidia bacterium]|nr:tetratricopeptide repeat protein [Dehalococcoidia bacterium]MDD5494186.1 tetratricopeptide repeat protein [Dehalococcoidia bacterium]